MKKLIFILLALAFTGLAQDSLDTMALNNPIGEPFNKPAKKLDINDYKNFYIGFLYVDNSMEVITLDIRHTQPTDSSISFQYTLNTKDTREEGIGEILPDQSLIRFQNMEEGRISLPDDGKIIFESISQDSLNYWKLKEK